MASSEDFGTDQPIVLRHQRHEATLLPGLGGRLASLRWLGEDGHWHDVLTPLVEPGFRPHHWPKAGAFPMLPFTNRMPPEGVQVDGVSAHPTVGPTGVAIHGLAHRQAWRLISRSGSSAQLGLSMASGVESWPWPWAARQDVSLTDKGLHLRLEVANTGLQPMPVSIGWHPYVVSEPSAHALGCRAAERLALDTAGRAALSASVAGASMQPGETAAFRQWTGVACIRWRPGYQVELRCDGAQHLVVHRPLAGGYLCVEPVTSLPGGLKGLQPGHEGMLEAGATKRLTIHCVVVAG